MESTDSLVPLAALAFSISVRFSVSAWVLSTPKKLGGKYTLRSTAGLAEVILLAGRLSHYLSILP